MPTFVTPDTERRLAELDARTRLAWATYRDDLVDLAGAAYVDAEAAAWDELQAALRAVEEERAALAAPQRA